MRCRILHEFAVIEREERVRILYAGESGSRAWGFASPESDYDPRFFYVRPPEWYLSIDFAHHRDVIERPADDLIDMSGWDLHKVLRLLMKSNPPLLEWLYSPIVYVDRYRVATRLREAIPEYFSVAACRYHYLHMASGNIRKYLSGEHVDRKRYFYILRPLLAVRWLDAGLGIVPMEFSILLGMVSGDSLLREAIEDLLQQKRNGENLADQPHIPEIQSFVDREMARLSGWEGGEENTARDAGTLNTLFREIVEDVWKGKHSPRVE